VAPRGREEFRAKKNAEPIAGDVISPIREPEVDMVFDDGVGRPGHRHFRMHGPTV
jgi:hypothetical protein